MATIRIYKVAEVLGIPSQEVLDVLKREHGIEAKSASSTIEEIVAKQFAERIARERNLSLPAGPLFSAKSRSASRGRKGAKTPERAARPRLGAPRLVKAPKVAPPVILEEPPDETEAPPVAGVTQGKPKPAEPADAPPPVPAATAAAAGAGRRGSRHRCQPPRHRHRCQPPRHRHRCQPPQHRHRRRPPRSRSHRPAGSSRRC